MQWQMYQKTPQFDISPKHRRKWTTTKPSWNKKSSGNMWWEYSCHKARDISLEEPKAWVETLQKRREKNSINEEEELAKQYAGWRIEPKQVANECSDAKVIGWTVRSNCMPDRPLPGVSQCSWNDIRHGEITSKYVCWGRRHNQTEYCEAKPVQYQEMELAMSPLTASPSDFIWCIEKSRGKACNVTPK